MRIHKVVCEVCNRRLGVAEEWAPGSAERRFRCMRCATEASARETGISEPAAMTEAQKSSQSKPS
jgi:hypothetical protein